MVDELTDSTKFLHVFTKRGFHLRLYIDGRLLFGRQLDRLCSIYQLQGRNRPRSALTKGLNFGVLNILCRLCPSTSPKLDSWKTGEHSGGCRAA
ncbi:hypothetical protein D3C85_1418900 [compost metagenome]